MMYLKNICFYFLGLIFMLLMACSPNESGTENQSNGFDTSRSDKNAIEIADKVINAMGGQKNWDNTRFINWNFFGSRMLYWDKLTGNVRIESSRDSFTVLLNVNDLTGKVMRNQKIVTDPDTLANFLKIGKSMWINDSYWLVMPFKLKDPGVILKYKGEGKTSEGDKAEIITLTFNSVGETPQNKYDVYVDPETSLVLEWAYYQNASDETPKFQTPWKQYKKYGNILLSSSRGDGYDLNDIEVLEEMPEAFFEEF